MARIGLLAGQGDLPKIFAKIAREKGDTVVAFGLKGVTADDLGNFVDKIHWFAWGDLKKVFFTLLTERIKSVVMLGKVKKEIVLKNDASLDDEAKKVMGKANSKSDYAVLNGVADALASIGVEVIDPTIYLKELIPPKGVLTRRAPTADEEEDILYGEKIATELARLDIGQAIIVKDKTIIAIEAAEGTDEAIRRAGALVKGGFTVVKSARPKQDMRLDVPVVGVSTVRAMAEAGGHVLALEEEKMFLVNKEETIALADEKGISIVVR